VRVLRAQGVVNAVVVVSWRVARVRMGAVGATDVISLLRI
jgi:hypothetical protein